MESTNKQLEGVLRWLECSICLVRFTKPKVLACLHTFCEKCLQQHVDSNAEGGLVPCPMCMVKTTVPEDGAVGFKDNFYIVQLSDIIPESSETMCEVCQLKGSNVTAVSVCIECRDNLCQGCADIHNVTKLTFSHRVVSLSDFRSGQHFDEIRSCHCLVHQEETLSCKIRPICLCRTLMYNQHKMASLTDAVKRVNEEMQTMIKQCQHIAKLSNELSGKSKDVENIDLDHSNLRKELTTVFKQFRDNIKHVIDKEEQAAFDQLNAQVSSAKKQAEIAFGEAEFNPVQSPIKERNEPHNPSEDFDDRLAAAYGGFTSRDGKRGGRGGRGRGSRHGGCWRGPRGGYGSGKGCDFDGGMGGGIDRPKGGDRRGGEYQQNFTSDITMGDQQGLMFGSSQGQQMEQVTIPKEYAGSVIGRGGRRIRTIRTSSGAGITIDEPLPNSNDRVITITGTDEQIRDAKFYLKQACEETGGDAY